MPVIKFGPWRPDAAALDVPVTVNVQNVIPATNVAGIAILVLASVPTAARTVPVEVLRHE